MVSRQEFKVQSPRSDVQGSTLNVALWTSHEGFTTAELLVAALFGMIVMATLYGFYRDQLFNLLSQETKTSTLEDARGALDIMTKELRNAGAWTSGTKPAGCSRIVSFSATKVQIQADLDGNGNCNSATGDFVGYALSATPCSATPCNITRQGSITDTSPGALVSNVIIPTGSSFLKYYNASGVETTTTSDIKRITIIFAVQAPNPNPTTKSAIPNITSTLSSSVVLRNN